MKASEHFDSHEDLEEAISEAESHATTGWAMEFIGDMRTKSERWGTEMYMSPKQYDALMKIANNE